MRIFKFCFSIVLSCVSLMTNAQDTVDEKLTNKSVLAIPISFGFGLGMRNHELFVTTEGDEVNLSAGGGLFIGSGLYAVTPKNIKIGTSFFYQVSNLRPVLENASASFKRIVITPEVKFPIFLKKDKYLNIGGGLSFYLNGKLKVDASETDGVKFASKYKNTSGIHFLVDYEEIMPKGLINIGLKYYSTKYTIESGDFLFPELKGSGIDLYISYAFMLDKKK